MARIGSKRAAHSRRLLLGFVSCVTLASFAGLTGASVAAAVPVINSESVSHVGEHEATLEAQLEPDGLETKYEFWLQYNACQSDQGASCEAIIVRSVGEGFIGAADTNMRVSASLTGLQAGYSYTFFVYAQNNGGWAKGESREFKTTSDAGGSLVTNRNHFQWRKTKPTPTKAPSRPTFNGVLQKQPNGRLPGQNAKKLNAKPTKAKLPNPIPRGLPRPSHVACLSSRATRLPAPEPRLFATTAALDT